MAGKTLFERIIDREIPADIVFEDDRCLAFRDIHPQAPVHVLMIPKKPIRSWADIADADADLMSHLTMAIRDLAKRLELGDGYRVICNCGPNGGQTVDHLHFHILGGRAMAWPPG